MTVGVVFWYLIKTRFFLNGDTGCKIFYVEVPDRGPSGRCQQVQRAIHPLPRIQPRRWHNISTQFGQLCSSWRRLVIEIVPHLKVGNWCEISQKLMIIINYLLAIFLDDQLNILPISSHVKTLEKAPPGKPILIISDNCFLNFLLRKYLWNRLLSHSQSITLSDPCSSRPVTSKAWSRNIISSDFPYFGLFFYSPVK